ncbi:MAG: substrate-binding domain-containing protein [Lachnospiraceae bacterium]|nr:substrate-binding domain-containing protein [Lachnospiraceae bacterium]
MITRRRRIGVLIGSATAAYMRIIINGMYQAAADLGIDLVVFAGTQLAYSFTDGDLIEKNHDFMNELTRSHVRENRLEGMIICYGSHAVFMDEDVRKRLLDMYSDVPYILIEEFTDKNNTGYLINDNYNSMRKVVEHMVKYHGYRKFLYVGGRANNREAIERRRALEDVFLENDIVFTDEMMIDGMFVEDCDVEVEILLDRNEKPEAIICANDLMAYAVYRVLKKRGIPIGNPRMISGAIAVTGYDDDVRAVSSDPPLTTVMQDFYYEGYTAVEKILALLRDGIVDSGIVPTLLQKRVSCGCSFGQVHRYAPMNETERTNPEFYAIKVSEMMREEILISNVREEIGDKVYDIIYEAVNKDIFMYNGLIKETLNSDVVINQLRRLVDSEYRRYISLNSLIRTYSDYVSSLIRGTSDQRAIEILADILVEGTKYLQNCILNMSDVAGERYEREALQMSLISRNMSLVADEGDEKMYYVALDKMNYCDSSDIYMFLKDKPINYSDGVDAVYKGKLYLVASKTEAEGIMTYSADNRPIVSKERSVLDFASEYGDEKGNRYCLAEIHHGDKLYGVLVSRMDDDDIMYLSLFAHQLALVLSYKFND